MSIGIIGVIGSGSMGGAFVRGWLRADPSMGSRILVADAAAPAAERLSREAGVGLARSNSDLVERADLVLLAVKPADVDAALEETIPLFDGGKLLASCVAGRTITSLEVLFSAAVPVFRLMPNVAVEVGAGTISFASGSNVDPGEAEDVKALFALLGSVIPIEEKLFPAATAIGGSGPGFLALIVDAFVDAGVMAGLPAAVSRELTFSMISGTARLFAETGMSPSELRQRVTSPAGTTAAGIAQLERDGTRSAIIDAVQVTVKRADELG
ncbi:MAG: pyrroline-5-carboxylate reductase [Thermoleophilia bacterium]|nr:pyrroline-5-carboxylate reductase [Thermoleophilia bacterium]